MVLLTVELILAATADFIFALYTVFHIFLAKQKRDRWLKTFTQYYTVYV